MPKLDVMLMRSRSGNQILDIDFGNTEHMMSTQGLAASVAGNGCSQPVVTSMAQVQHYGYVPVTAAPTAAAAPVQPQHAYGQPPVAMPSVSMPGSAMLPVPSRKLKIIEHHVHRIDTHQKESGEPEEELVVSNLRHFSLKVAVVDMNDIPLLDTELPLQATLLYENGLPVKQLSNSEPLLVGEPEVVALQGTAIFKLRITSLSSHRDKQRFRIQIAPQNPILRHNEPALTIVTDPMKSVTKLAHRSQPKDATPQPAAPNGPAPALLPPPESGVGFVGTEAYNKRMSAYDQALKQQGEQIGQLQEMHSLILKQLQDLNSLVRGLVETHAAATDEEAAAPASAAPAAQEAAPEHRANGAAERAAAPGPASDV